MKNPIPLRDHYVQDLIQRMRVATDDFTVSGEIHLPLQETLEFIIEEKLVAMCHKTSKVLSLNGNEDGSATISFLI